MLADLNFVIICVTFLCFTVNTTNGDCPKKGPQGGKNVPDVLSINKDQKGFSATVEIITPEQESIMIYETYNGAKLYGSIDIDWVDRGRTSTHYYYQTTKESYIVESYDCLANELTTEEKYNVINDWIMPEEAKDEIDLFGSLEILGPSVLMTYAASVSNQAQWIGSERIDGRIVGHWFHCLSEEINLDWWFESSTNLPFRFTLSSAKNLTDPHVYNFLIFTPVANTVNDVIQYPIGFGCYRQVKDQPKLPEFINSEMFSLNAEAMIMYNNPDQVLLSSLRMMKYQETYSFEISDGSNTTRIIQNPAHMGRYTVNSETGECKPEDLDYEELFVGNLAVTWPFHKRVGFNLLKSIIGTSGLWSNYMGQIKTDGGLMDVWEEDLNAFFTEANHMDASVSYYFPVIDRTKKSLQPPAKLIIKPHDRQQMSISQRIPSQIEIVFIDYAESDFDLSDLFDVSGCFDGPGQFTWFQIVMSDGSPGTHTKDLTDLKTYFEQTLATFIPKIRIPEVVVNLYDFNYYITAKLLERPPFMFHYYTGEKYRIGNPTSIIIRDHLEDCGEVCTNNPNCKEFAYCSDFSCQIFASTTYPTVLSDDKCSSYQKRVYGDTESVISRNILASTRNILSQIKAKVNSGEFLVPKYLLSAEDLFVVSGPEEIGGVEEEFDDSIVFLKGDEYSVIVSDSRLSVGETFDSVDYSDCLKLCQNDDDCYSLSYCFNQHKECVLSTESKANLTKYLSEKTSYADGCDVFERSFIAFYRKFPGQSLVNDAIVTIPNIDESECARQCYEATGFPCKSFDICRSNSESKTECFLHQFHVVEDTAHAISEGVWDFSESKCDHYAVKLSRDYSHYVGRKYAQGSVNILEEISDVSLERCASDCNSEGNCNSFEYCESPTNGQNLRVTCRLSSSASASFVAVDSTSEVCSIYLNMAKIAENSKVVKGSDHFGIAMGLGSFFFVVAFTAGIVGSIYYQKRF